MLIDIIFPVGLNMAYPSTYNILFKNLGDLRIYYKNGGNCHDYHEIQNH